MDELLRWEQAGGSWRVVTHGEGLTVSMCRCDGGEEVDRIVSTGSELAVYVTTRPGSED